jgi:hypothetical protein
VRNLRHPSSLLTGCSRSIILLGAPYGNVELTLPLLPTQLLLFVPKTPRPCTCCPEYHLYAFKILSCPLKTSHDWSSCPWAHPKEQARRRDPRRYYYTPVMCPYAKMVYGWSCTQYTHANNHCMTCTGRVGGSCLHA